MERSFVPLPITLAIFGHALLTQEYVASGWVFLGIAVFLAVGGFIFEVTQS